MPAPVNLGTMRTRVRQWADAEVGAAGQAISDTELDYRINSALKALYDKLVDARGAEYFALEHPAIPIVAGQANYSITATDFYQLIAVRLNDGTRFVTLDKWMPQEKGHLLTFGAQQGGSSIYTIRYRLRRDQIQLLPAPQNTTWTLNLDYVPRMTELVLAGDTFDGLNGWEDWAILTAAIGILQKQEVDITSLLAQRDMIDQRINRLVTERDAGRPEHIQDVMGDWAGNDWYDAGYDEGGW